MIKPIAASSVSRRFQSIVFCRWKSKSSSIWLNRQREDAFSKQAKEDNYKSRAAYKLKQINTKYRIFRPGQTVVDLGFAPGSWSQVAVKCTQPNGRVIGVDLLPVEPPAGVTAIQGNFLNAGVQEQLCRVIRTPRRGRWTPSASESAYVTEREASEALEKLELTNKTDGKESYEELSSTTEEVEPESHVDLVLSDMCGIWPQETGFWTNSINYPYRLANTSGIVARDHTSSMDLCDAGLVFCIKNLRKGGIYVCKFYTGSEDKGLENRLKKVFRDVRRMKPDASRAESREAYFIAKNKRRSVDVRSVFEDP